MYNGSFPFKSIGDDIPDGVPYIQMRLFNALLGVSLVPVRKKKIIINNKKLITLLFIVF